MKHNHYFRFVAKMLAPSSNNVQLNVVWSFPKEAASKSCLLQLSFYAVFLSGFGLQQSSAILFSCVILILGMSFENSLIRLNCWLLCMCVCSQCVFIFYLVYYMVV